MDDGASTTTLIGRGRSDPREYDLHHGRPPATVFCPPRPIAVVIHVNDSRDAGHGALINSGPKGTVCFIKSATDAEQVISDAGIW
jgi:hypothetical protein